GANSASGPNVGVSIAPGGITNPLLQNSSLGVLAGTGLAGGGMVSLGGSITLSNAGVTSFNGRTGAVTPAAGDYSLGVIFEHTSSVVTWSVPAGVTKLWVEAWGAGGGGGASGTGGGGGGYSRRLIPVAPGDMLSIAV